MSAIDERATCATMNCRRCQGTMVQEVFADRHYDAGPGAFMGWRCIICGAILDPLIMQHQTIYSKLAGRRPRMKRGGMLFKSSLPHPR